MEIRFAAPKDIPGIIALLHQVGEVHHRLRPELFRSGALKYGEAALSALIGDENSPIFVAVDGDLVLGYCICQIRDYRGSSVLTDRKELYIDDLCVDEAHRGRGIASALYRHTQNYAKGTGCAFLTLNVWCGNEAAMSFYEKQGMKPRSITMELSLEDN